MVDSRTPAQRARYRARRRRQLMDRWLPLWLVLPVLMIVLLVSLPVTLPIAAMLQRRDGRRLRAAAPRAACLACGAPLGQEALDRADAAWAVECAAFQKSHPNGIRRMVRRVFAVCGVCGAGHDFDTGRGVFSLNVASGGVGDRRER